MSQFDEEEFKKFENKIDDVLKILHDMSQNGISSVPTNADSMDDTKENISLKDNVPDEESFIVKVRDNRTVINNKIVEEPSASGREPHTVDKFTFMQQLEQDANRRAENRRNRETIADNFRKLGNDAFKNKKYEEAINLYTKALDHVKDSPILYNNRALSCIKLKLYKRSLIDSDYVVNRLDEKNLRAWLYRAVAYYNLDDEVNFEKSVRISKKHNADHVEYIDKFVKSIKDI